MLALPIARRELLVLSRGASAWRKRLATSALIFTFGITFALIYHYAGQMMLGQAMHVLGFGLWMVCLFAGVHLTSDAIAQEKREGTLGLLFLTNLSSFEIVLGKLVAHGLLGFYAVLCVLPLFSVSMVLGGMRFTDVLLHILSALNVLFFSAAVGLFASCTSQDHRKAAGRGVLIVVLLCASMPLLALLLAFLNASPSLTRFVAVLPLNLLPPRAAQMTNLGVLSPGWSLLWTQALAWAFIGLAAWLLPRRWQDKPLPTGSRLRALWKTISLGNPAARLKLRRALLDRNPFLWLASRDRFQAVATWIITFAALGFIAWLFFRGVGDTGLFIAMVVLLSVSQQVSFNGAAAGQLLNEYEQGTLEMLLSTPLSVHDVARGQFTAALRQHRSAFALTFLLLWAGVLLLVWQGRPVNLITAAALALYSGLFLFQFYALGWVSMWTVVRAPDPKRAKTNAFGLVTLLPVLLCGCFVASVNTLTWLTRTAFSPPPGLLLAVFLVLAFANAFFWLRLAKRELPQHLRLFAFRRYTAQEPLTLFGRLGRSAGLWFRRKVTRTSVSSAPPELKRQ